MCFPMLFKYGSHIEQALLASISLLYQSYYHTYVTLRQQIQRIATPPVLDTATGGLSETLPSPSYPNNIFLKIHRNDFLLPVT